MTESYWPIPKLWPGATVVCIASGPSLTLKQVRHVALARLEERCRVIAVNDAVYVAWFADWLHATDNKWWMWHRKTATKFPGVKTTMVTGCPEAWGVKMLRNKSLETPGQYGGYTDDQDALCTGGNGGYQAAQIAVKGGARKVILIGYDMKFGPNNESHFHGDHPDEMRSDYENTMLQWWPGLAEALSARGIEVINCSPDSAIGCFPKASLANVL